jgi:trehalose 6-phosphate phosphatase
VDLQSSLVPPPSLAHLQQSSRIGLFLDFDGTLVEIASGPDAIVPPVDLACRLQALATQFDEAVALVSGRSIANLRRFLGPVCLTLAGSHGGHIITADGTCLREAQAMPKRVSERLRLFAQERGLLYEAKTHGAALHYRSHPDLGQEACDFALALAREHGLVTKAGKCVIELVQPGADKGAAVELLHLQPEFRGTIPVFVGDDVTDEDGFAACNRLGGFGVIVGERAGTAARYRLETVKDVLAWLNL